MLFRVWVMSEPLPGPVSGNDGDGAFNYRLWSSDAFGFLANLGRVYGDVVGFHLGCTPCILVNGAPEVRKLMTRWETHLRKPEFVMESNRAGWGEGLTTLEGAAWRDRRKVLRRCFSASRVSAQQTVVTQCTTEMLDSWASGSLGDPVSCMVVDLQDELRLLVARIALRTLLDADVEGAEGAGQRSGLLPRVQAVGVDYKSIAGGDPSAPLWQRRPRAPASMDALIRIIDERINGGEHRDDVLSLLLGDGEGGSPALSRDEIVGEIMQMLYAGHLTIPVSLMNLWRETAEPAWTMQLEAEADLYHAGGYRVPVSQAGSQCLSLLKESLRLHPPAPILYREVDTPFELAGHGFDRDALVLVCPQLLQRDSRYFTCPDRFSPGRCLADPFMPFGIGPRSCIASHLAMQQMTQIALLVSARFRINPIPDVQTHFRLQARAVPSS